VKSVGETPWQRDGFWLYGVVAPLSGCTFFAEFSHLDRTCFQPFFDRLSLEWGDDR
jgi:hypothetical protein